ncbi:unnamed protein product, partial [Symbiodinium pilosum]
LLVFGIDEEAPEIPEAELEKEAVLRERPAEPSGPPPKKQKPAPAPSRKTPTTPIGRGTSSGGGADMESFIHSFGLNADAARTLRELPPESLNHVMDTFAPKPDTK